MPSEKMGVDGWTLTRLMQERYGEKPTFEVDTFGTKRNRYPRKLLRRFYLSMGRYDRYRERRASYYQMVQRLGRDAVQRPFVDDAPQQ